MRSHCAVTCGLLLVSLTMITASVIHGPLHDEPLHRDARGAGCRLSDGRTIPDGDNFTRLDTGPCVSYLCQDGNVLPLDYKCFRDNLCYPLNDVYKLGCIERTCKFTQGRFEYVLSREACTGRDQSTCIDVGTTHKDGCFLYRCDKEQESPFSVSYHLKQIDFGCELNGQCVPENHTVTQGCRTIQCQKRFMSVGFFTISDGCEINGKCVDVGSSIVENCRTLTCTEENLNGLRVLNIAPTKIQCKDADGVCHDGGEWFPLLVDNKDRVNCTCHVTGLTIGLSCPSIGLTVQN